MDQCRFHVFASTRRKYTHHISHLESPLQEIVLYVSNRQYRFVVDADPYHTAQKSVKECIGNSHIRAAAKPAKLIGSLSQFKSLFPDDFKGHEFLLIKPTGKLNSIVCHHYLESADDILDIPGFGHNQHEVMWAHNNQHDSTAKVIRK